MRPPIRKARAPIPTPDAANATGVSTGGAACVSLRVGREMARRGRPITSRRRVISSDRRRTRWWTKPNERTNGLEVASRFGARSPCAPYFLFLFFHRISIERDTPNTNAKEHNIQNAKAKSIACGRRCIHRAARLPDRPRIPPSLLLLAANAVAAGLPSVYSMHTYTHAGLPASSSPRSVVAEARRDDAAGPVPVAPQEELPVRGGEDLFFWRGG